MEAVFAEGAVIAWSTNVGAGSLVHYGEDRTTLAETQESPYTAGTHRVILRNLLPNTTYYFDVDSAQGAGTGTEARSPVHTFTTPPAAQGSANDTRDTHGFAGPIAQDVTDHSAVIWWVSGAPETARLSYGEQRDRLVPIAADNPGTPARNHAAVLQHLQPETTYYYAITLADGKPRETGQFTTEPRDYQNGDRVWSTKGPFIESLDSTAAQIAWSTNTRASTLVRYNSDPTNLDKTATAPWGEATHRVVLKNLKPDTTYYFVVESAQAQRSGTMSKGDVNRFHTPRPGEPALKPAVPGS